MCWLLINKSKDKIYREVLGDLDHMTDIYLVRQMSKSVRLLWWAVASHGNFDLGYVTIEVVWVNVKQQHQLTQVEGGYIEGSLHSNSTDLPHLLSKWSTSTQHHMPKQARSFRSSERGKTNNSRRVLLWKLLFILHSIAKSLKIIDLTFHIKNVKNTWQCFVLVSWQ